MIYALHDSNPELKRKGAFLISKQDIEKYNSEGYGIFWTPNKFNGARKAENVTEIRFWVADIDEGTKEEQMSRIDTLPLKPSFIVETKKGYHCYWRAIDATLDSYRDIECGLIERLKADKACKDVCRLLRYPNCYHCKDPQNRFLVHTVLKNDKEYTERQMLYVFRLPKPVYKPIKYEGDNKDMLDPKNWEKIFHISQICEGGRNNELSRITFWLRDVGFDRATIEQTVHTMNNMLVRPLDKWEVNSIIRSKL